jgi:hypothetical protein
VRARRPRWWPLAASIVIAAVSLWVTATGWVGIRGSHPAFAVTLAVVLAGAITLGLWAVRRRARPVRGPRRRWTARVGLVVVTALICGVLVYLRPLAAEPVAIEALAGTPAATVDESATRILLEPVSDSKGTGLVYYPGALVDPRAYLLLLLPVAEAGYPVRIVKHPFNLAILGSDAAAAVVGDPDDDVDRWVIGGHSLGGAMAARFAESDRDELVGLVLHAAYPADDLSGREGLLVTSIYGTADTVASVGDVLGAGRDLPADTRFRAVDGAIHAHFGHYGPQRGDGTPTIDRTVAQAEIVAATLALLDAVTSS